MLKLDKIIKTYNKGKNNAFEALHGISLTVESGEMVAIVGTSGAGKSTLLHILACIDGYDSGEYYIDALIEEFTALDNVMIPLDFAARGKKKGKKERKEIAIKMLEMVQMQNFADKPVNSLSGGQKQRVAIARAIVNEPTREIMKVFIDLNKQGKTIIIVTHDLTVAEQCSRVIKIEDGVIIEGN